MYSVKSQYWSTRSTEHAQRDAVFAAPPGYNSQYSRTEEEDYSNTPDIALASQDGLRELLGSITKDDEATDDAMSEHQPADLTVKLMAHQLHGVKWMKEKDEKGGGILADDMGLGKTVQTLGLIVSNKPEERTCKTTLIVAPIALLHQWESEIKTKTKKGLLRVLIHHGPKRPKDPSALTQYDVVLTSYNVVSSEFPKPPAKKGKKADAEDESDDDEPEVPLPKAKKGALFGVKWFRVILDEAQNIKNRSTKAATACFELDAGRRWCLTGTPVQNNIGELYSLFKFLRLKQFQEYKDFKQQFIEPMSCRRMKLVTKRLQVVLAATTLRRTKTSRVNGKPLLNLPTRNVRLVKVEFTRGELAFYSSLEGKMKSRLKSLLKESSNAYANILCLLLRLRQACNHRYLVGDIGAEENQLNEEEDDGALDEMTSMLDNLTVKVKQKTCTICFESIGSGTDRSVCGDCAERLAEPSSFISSKKGKNTAMISGLRQGWVSSAKIDKMMSILSEVNKEAPDEKVIIFSQFTSMLDIVELPLAAGGHKFCRYDGSMNSKEREASLTRFKEDKSVRVLLLSFKCGSLGLNLTVANRIVMLDIWWNPALEDQAIDRVHRIGQTRPVEVVRLTVEGTVEDRILQLQDKKRALISGALDEGAASALRNKKLTTEDLLRLFVSGDDDDEILKASRKAH
ncbi:hypothetical protein HK097_011360 [Rhizophlyctis rosea]|uniref:Uncharacterized protein n=1 Tax=Rhizophlyctis rosea TaxID=64517 RepID=A0AAD5S8W1_9FUNG|nr:hypothetical protein HK097_011360 [Rhizophlyctis rosea]